MQLKRKIRLTLSEEGEDILISNDLRVDFVVEQSIGNALNTAKIIVYNLAPDTITNITGRESGKVKVKLEVGDSNSNLLDTLFQGDLINIHSTPNFEDHLTSLWCWERGTKDLQKPVEKIETFLNSTVKDISERILANIKDEEGVSLYTINFDAVTGGKQDTVIRAYVSNRLPQVSIADLLAQNGMISTIKGATLVVTDSINNKEAVSKAADNTNIPKFAVNPLLLKKPVQYSKATADISYVLTPNVYPLDVVYIDYKSAEAQSSLGGYGDKLLQIVDGIKDLLPKDFYFISKVIHTGSLYSDSWDTQMKGIIYSDNIKG